MTRMRRIGVLTGVSADDPEFKGAPYGRASTTAIGLDPGPQRADRLPLWWGDADPRLGRWNYLRVLFLF